MRASHGCGVVAFGQVCSHTWRWESRDHGVGAVGAEDVADRAPAGRLERRPDHGHGLGPHRGQDGGRGRRRADRGGAGRVHADRRGDDCDYPTDTVWERKPGSGKSEAVEGDTYPLLYPPDSWGGDVDARPHGAGSPTGRERATHARCGCSTLTARGCELRRPSFSTRRSFTRTDHAACGASGTGSTGRASLPVYGARGTITPGGGDAVARLLVRHRLARRAPLVCSLVANGGALLPSRVSPGAARRRSDAGLLSAAGAKVPSI